MPNRVTRFVITSAYLAIGLRASERQDETSIRDILRLQTEAWDRGDGKAWAKDFTDDCDFVNLRGDILHGRDQLGAQITASLQGRMKGSHLSLAIRHFSWLAADVALVETDYEITGIFKAGSRRSRHQQKAF